VQRSHREAVGIGIQTSEWPIETYFA